MEVNPTEMDEMIKKEEVIKQEQLLPFIKFRIAGEQFFVDWFIPDNSDTGAIARFLNSLNKGECLESILQSIVVLMERFPQSPQPKSLLDDWYNIISHTRPAVRPTQVFRGG